jgi:hypothetical protein
VKSPSPTCSASPPVAGRIVPDHSRRGIDVSEVAELPEFFGCPGVLKDEFVDFECVEFTGVEALNGYLDATDKFAKLFLVIGRHCLASRPTI